MAKALYRKSSLFKKFTIHVDNYARNKQPICHIVADKQFMTIHTPLLEANSSICDIKPQ